MAPDFRKYGVSIGSELKSVMDRVTDLLGHAHLPSEGTYREILLRDVLRKHLPKSVQCGTGFVVDSNGPSTQIDILIYRSDKPVLFQQDDFVIITPDCARAAIEVKTSEGQINDGLEALAGVSRKARDPNLLHRSDYFWTGLFVYNHNTLKPDTLLGNLYDAANKMADSVVNFVAVGPSLFARFWNINENPWVPDGVGREPLPCGAEAWHAYKLNDLASAYFIGNVIDAMSELPWDAQHAWFSEGNGKENSRKCCVSLHDEQIKFE